MALSVMRRTGHATLRKDASWDTHLRQAGDSAAESESGMKSPDCLQQLGGIDAQSQNRSSVTTVAHAQACRLQLWRTRQDPLGANVVRQ